MHDERDNKSINDNEDKQPGIEIAIEGKAEFKPARDTRFVENVKILVWDSIRKSCDNSPWIEYGGSLEGDIEAMERV